MLNGPGRAALVSARFRPAAPLMAAIYFPRVLNAQARSRVFATRAQGLELIRHQQLRFAHWLEQRLPRWWRQR